jgi:steroid 5-alpha reductase family enzyme/SAM-dependent methyltransferase
MSSRSGKAAGIVWCAVAYAVAIGAGIGAGYGVRDLHPLLVVAVADVVGTAVIFAFSRAFNNSSLYDPYWSVAPMAIVLYWAADAPERMRAIVMVALVWAWGARLTYNFLKGWPGLHHEDWRYVNIRNANGRMYWLVSFFGIHLAPTVWVYLGCLAFYPALTSSRPLGVPDAGAVLLTAGAIALEAIADRQLWQFRRSNPAPGAIMKSGLWRTSRHPNYLGEICFWWGLFAMGLAAEPSLWWTIAGPLSITALFVFISVPMIDKRHLERRSGYAEHMRTCAPLIPVGLKRQVGDPTYRDRQLEVEVAAALDASPALTPYLPELLADLDELGSSADTVCDLIAPLELEVSSTRVLDLGCGKGPIAIALTKRFGYRALGVDGFAPFVEEAGKAAAREGVTALCTFRHGDLRDALAANPPFDIVVLAAVGRVLGDMRETMRQLRRAVRPGGYMVIDDCYLADGHAIDKANYRDYEPHAETIAAMEAFGDTVVQEVISSQDEMRAENIENTRLIRARAEALAKEHPQDAAVLMEFVAEQEDECAILENDLVAATWLIRRGPD